MSQGLDVRRPERLVRSSTVSVSRTRISGMLNARAVLRGERRASNTLVGVRCLLNADLLMRALAAAAAHAEEPEESRRETKSNGEPEDRQHLAAHGGLDVVWFEYRFKNTSEDGVDGSRSCGRGDDEDGLRLRFLLAHDCS
jgi:hypothetical protein